ncbi:MAG: bis(5'-nucleosyl)-tetraphosphatase (symmetrical) YqeK [Calothrix sp. MO_167.B42]|nr:bis(5'-nucleosyl)-tetraphosphatase (symmetrical) YqeK [Calothrix sp. MO_167.B42]
MVREQVLSWLAENVKASRIEHILRVEQMAKELALQHQLEPQKSAQAALMHDLAKYFPAHKLLQMASIEGLEIDEIMNSNPHLLHADVSAIVARDTFGIEDKEILQAIANHTLGRPDMGPVCCIVFLADSLEPGRGNNPELSALRQMSRKNIDGAVWQVCDYSLKSLVNSPGMIHPRIIATRNRFLQQWKSQQSIAHINP